MDCITTTTLDIDSGLEYTLPWRQGTAFPFLPMVTDHTQLEEQLANEKLTLEAILDNVDQGLVMYDRHHRLQAWNQKWVDLLGFDAELLAGRPRLDEIIRNELERGIDSHLPGDVDAKVRFWMEQVTSATGPYLSQQTLPDGRCIEMWTNPLPLGGLVRTLTDVTERRHAEQTLRDSEAKFRGTLEASPAAVAICDRDGALLFWNTRLEKMLGTDAAYLQIADFKDFYVNISDREGFMRTLDGGDVVRDYEIRLLRQDGSEFWALMSVERTNFDGTPGSFSWLYDVSELKRVQKSLRQSEERYAMAMEGANEGLWDWDVDADKIFISKRFGILMGVNTDKTEIKPQKWLGRMHPGDGDHYRDCLMAHLRGSSEYFDSEFRVLGDDQTYRWVRAHGRGRRDAAGRVYRMAGSLDDVTARKQAEIELLEAKRLTDKANGLVTEKNMMLEGLSSKLSKYLAPQIYTSIFTGKQSVEVATERKKLTVCFTDIADFTEITDNLAHEDLTTLLNDYLTEMSQIALAYGATIDKFIGDSIMLFFGDPETSGVQDDAVNCVKMALAMQRRMAELQVKWGDIGVEAPFQLRVGINTGYCAVGNFGSEDRIDYTIIGSEVNLASRLQTHAELGGVLMAYETYCLVKESILAEEQSLITVKGIARQIRTYKVVGIHDDLEAAGQLIRTEQDGIKVTVDLNQRDSEAAIQVIEGVLRDLKRKSLRPINNQ